MASQSSFTPLVTIVGFHHAKGPEIESWFGADDGSDPAVDNEWSLLPFMALSDGAHVSTEDFSYFTLRKEATAIRPATSLFGISCTRQMDASLLINRPPEVTRSTVQKAVVVIADSPQAFGQVREKLSMVTKAWFAQRDFTDMDIIKKFQESLIKTLQDNEDERDQYLGLSLRELIHEFRHQTLILFKCCLLQPKMLFFGSRCERLCMMQFSLLSLIPGLIRNLQDCADPELDSYHENLVKPTSLKTSDRTSLLSYMGLPLQIFGKGALFGPYTPLQQLDLLADYGTKSYIVGSTNSLLLQQRDRYSDILINLDEETINITSASLKAALALSVADRRWIDFIFQSVQDTWDDSNPSRPKTMGYMGSEEFIRLQFEEYLLSLISAVKYHIYLQEHHGDSRALLADVEGDPSNDFGPDWIQAWMQTENFRIFQKSTDSHLFDIVEPHHPCAGGLTMEDIQRRLAQQVSELHLDERFHTSKEVLGKHLATGQKKVTSAFNNLWADIEVMREAQRRRHEELKEKDAADAAANGTPPSRNGGSPYGKHADFSSPQATLSTASKSATAYFSSWTSWAGEKRRTGWGRTSSSTSPPPKQSNLKRRSGERTLEPVGKSGLLPFHMSSGGSGVIGGTTASSPPLHGARKKSYEEEMFEATDTHSIGDVVELKERERERGWLEVEAKAGGTKQMVPKKHIVGGMSEEKSIPAPARKPLAPSIPLHTIASPEIPVSRTEADAKDGVSERSPDLPPPHQAQDAETHSHEPPELTSSPPAPSAPSAEDVNSTPPPAPQPATSSPPEEAPELRTELRTEGRDTGPNASLDA